MNIDNKELKVIESNALILRKGRCSLLSSKVMLLSLLKLEDRNPSLYSTQKRDYYKRIEAETGVDYSKGLVAEMTATELREMLFQKKSGYFYAALRELFDAQSPKGLRANWAVMLPRKSDSDLGEVLGYTEIVVATHYLTKKGKLLIKFNSEEYIKKQLYHIKSEFAELELAFILRLSSVHSYRTAEILTASISTENTYDGFPNSSDLLKEQYVFTFPVGELMLMLGVIDATVDAKGREQLSKKNPDYNKIAEDINTRQLERRGNFRFFRSSILDTALEEINNTDEAPFTVTYDIEKDSHNRKVENVIFYVKRKNILITKVNTTSQLDTCISELRKDKSFLALSRDDLERIAVASEYDCGIINSALDLYTSLNVTESFVTWFEKLRQ